MRRTLWRGGSVPVEGAGSPRSEAAEASLFAKRETGGIPPRGKLMTPDLICVKTVSTVEEGDIVVTFLAAHGIDAHVSDRNTIGLSGMPPTRFFRKEFAGIEVVVPGREQADLAGKLLASRGALAGAIDDLADRTKMEAECGGCGETLWFCEDDTGKIEECPYCGREIEIPAFGEQDH